MPKRVFLMRNNCSVNSDPNPYAGTLEHCWTDHRGKFFTGRAPLDSELYRFFQSQLPERLNSHKMPVHEGHEHHKMHMRQP